MFGIFNKKKKEIDEIIFENIQYRIVEKQYNYREDEFIAEYKLNDNSNWSNCKFILMVDSTIKTYSDALDAIEKTKKMLAHGFEKPIEEIIHKL